MAKKEDRTFDRERKGFCRKCFGCIRSCERKREVNMSYTLRKEDSGQEVVRLQKSLCGLTADGLFGRKTDQAVRDYQAKQGLAVDGIAGPVTLGVLGIPVLYGVDLSSHNGTVDFGALASSGCKFAWVKLTEGTTHTNPGFEEKFKGCRDNGIVVGAYHFGRPDTYTSDPTDAKDEADNFLNALSKVGFKCGDLLPVLDLEAGVKTDDQHNIDWALNWLDALECAERVHPVIYTAKWYYDTYMKNASKSSLDDLAKYPLWLASYNTGAAPDRKVASWKTWDIWQWSGSGSVPGVKGKCDQNWMAGGALDSLRLK
jgi:GH25 family lysozyme M1 (1,4-beta-N-acetylmuramidase)